MRYYDTALDGPESGLAAWLLPRIHRAECVALRTGFVSETAINECLTALSELLDRQGEVVIVLGGEGQQADPAALQGLLQLTARSEQADVRVVTGAARFQNAKTYYVRYPDGQAEAWVGSANLTHAGLHSNDEAALTLDSTVDSHDTLQQIRSGITVYSGDPGAETLSSDLIRTLADRYRPASHSAGMAATTLWEDLLQPAMDELDTVASQQYTAAPVYGVSTGLADLDDILGFLRPGTFTVIASRPGIGRSTLLLDIVRACAVRQGNDVALFNLETPTSEITQRILSAEARVRLQDLRCGRMNDNDWTRLARRMSEISNAPLWINTTPNASVDALCAETAHLQQQHGLSLITVDPLSAVTAAVEPGASREREVSTVARRLKSLALHHSVPVVATAELKRDPDWRYNKEPFASDLRESDTIHQVADNVILINRPDAWERDHPRAGEADLILAKHRSGPSCTVTVAHQLHYSRFADLALE